MSTKLTKQLPNLDAVRALAALIVVVSHIELQKMELGLANIRPLVRNFGSMGVTVFFVLSGFLITYLLTLEHTHHGKINIVSFYFRRILRIWPLYFVVLLIGAFIYPGNLDSVGLWLSIFFLPNIAFMLEKLPGLIDPIWSLGVEEQFYMFHPHFFRQQRIKAIFNTLIGMFLFFYALKFTASVLHWEWVSKVMYKARFDCMMLGGITSMWVVNHLRGNRWFTTPVAPPVIFGKPVQYLLFGGFLAYLVAATAYAPLYNDQLLSILTAALLANLALNPQCVVNIEQPQLVFIGKISFGLYLLHKFPVEAMIRASEWAGITSLFGQNLFIYGLSLPLAIALAWLSYHYYETYFLRMKDKKFATPAPAKPVLNTTT